MLGTQITTDHKEGVQITMIDNKNTMLTMSEIVKLTKIGRRRIENEIKRGNLKAYKLGFLWRFYRSDVQEWLENQQYTPTTNKEIN